MPQRISLIYKKKTAPPPCRNFTKFLVDKSGKVVKRYETNVKPESIKADILAKL